MVGEQFTVTGWIDDIAKTRWRRDLGPRRGCIDRSGEETPGEDESPDYDLIEDEKTTAKYRLYGYTATEVITRESSSTEAEPPGLQAVDVCEILESRRLPRSIHADPRRASTCTRLAAAPAVSRRT